jgi:hypothetical protein
MASKVYITYGLEFETILLEPRERVALDKQLHQKALKAIGKIPLHYTPLSPPNVNSWKSV